MASLPPHLPANNRLTTTGASIRCEIIALSSLAVLRVETRFGCQWRPSIIRFHRSQFLFNEINENFGFRGGLAVRVDCVDAIFLGIVEFRQNDL